MFERLMNVSKNQNLNYPDQFDVFWLAGCCCLAQGITGPASLAWSACLWRGLANLSRGQSLSGQQEFVN